MKDIELWHGDCLELMKNIPDNSIDAIITDLPYGTTACKWDTVIPFESMWEESKRILKINGTFITTASQPFTSALIMSNPSMFKYCNIWKKTMPSDFLNSKNKPMKIHEDIVIFSKGTTANGSKNKMTYIPQMRDGKPYYKKHIKDPRVGYVDAGDRTPYLGESINNGTRYPISVVEFSNGNNFSVHPTQKPVTLYEYLIRTYTREGEAVLDIAMGSGTTGVACKNLGRRFIGIEKDRKYFDIAVQRING